MSEYSWSVSSFREVLSEAGYKLTEDGLSIMYPLNESDNSSLSSYGDCDDTDNTLLQYNNEDVPTENWDIWTWLQIPLL